MRSILTTLAFVLAGSGSARAVVPMVMLTMASRSTTHPLQPVQADLKNIPELKTDASIAAFTLLSGQLTAAGQPVMALRAPEAVALQPMGEKRFAWIPTDDSKPSAIVHIPPHAVSTVWDHLTEGVASGDYTKAHAALRELYEAAARPR